MAYAARNTPAISVIWPARQTRSDHSFSHWLNVLLFFRRKSCGSGSEPEGVALGCSGGGGGGGGWKALSSSIGD